MPTGQNITYSATVPQKRVVTDRILMTDAIDLVAIKALGLNNESSFAFANGPGGPNQAYEWLSDTRADLADAINTENLTSDSSLTSVVVDTGALFQIGDVILVDAEYMHITGISTNTLTVARDWGGNNTTHSDNAVVTIVGRSRIEGTNTSDSAYTEPSSQTNCVNIYHKEIDISRSAANLQRYGIGDLVNWEVDKAMIELPRLLNRSFYHGQRKAGSSTTASSAGGFRTFATTNKNALSSTPALTQKNIEDEIQDCWDAGGNPTMIFCNTWAKRKIADFYAGSVRTERSETMGGITIDRIMSPLNVEMSVIVDRDCQTDFLYLVDPLYTGFVTIDPFFWELLGKVGDTAAFGQVVGEYSLVVANQTWQSYISGFSTSA
jgi:hypothetical protein